MAETWDCEAYGPDGTAVGALCFFASSVNHRTCASREECRTRMAEERKRVFRDMQHLAASGDPVYRHLAEEFTHPEQMLGGSRDPED